MIWISRYKLRNYFIYILIPKYTIAVLYGQYYKAFVEGGGRGGGISHFWFLLIKIESIKLKRAEENLTSQEPEQHGFETVCITFFETGSPKYSV